MRKLFKKTMGYLPAMLLTPSLALADEVPTINSGDTAWMITATALVLLMTLPGLALFYGGMVRKKNVLSVCMQTISIAALMSVLWVVCGYSLAFTEGNAFIGDLSKAFLSGVGVDAISGTIPETVFATFQMTFAIITPVLIIGAFAERMKFSAILAFMTAWVLAVYAPVTHWVWGGGFLGAAGTLDFAGGTVVHINAGVAGLVCALVLGKRIGYPKEGMMPHNLTLTMIGTAMLWVGWFGFNAGSELAADGTAGMAMLVTQVATAMAVLAWTFAEWVVYKKPSLLGACSGAVAGLVAITPASGFVGPMGALAIGLAAGLVCFWAVTSLKKMLGYDDSLDAFGVHAVGGIVGAMLTGVFVSSSFGGAGFAEGVTMVHQLAVQGEAVLYTIVYDAVVTYVILKLIDMVIGLRVTEEQEREGLDITQHGEQVYE
ncbi:MAG: ammonia channel protein [Zetaproteobacteria bacterium CG12_big_fil_rev_8_21_14_0_65_55_1124]|nr:MAG: ammonia channel protein [Zetaproteobacteria bacterium CG1_02_55_237]PIS19727.1 MAG: ammonia channel protein [Zetaproteobacteria bacterium CG08_land_8_20_14_0_20_55_17]PIW43493.1 MAG: ammonia channel protein [Zetaproteobacteria bacterium CG12_big_fil_rev_8_21_14_0_65_55_1124]PIY54124.1 MAG: ammonia channel protein [Zetaproteobacteria bacterium CG_4_10_14_0_8_um_filter_55_43]PIZ39118.1 MAG: ammonia channel protein [Zetaproteobacteria bacterium CG_4_10_14_0_2_um_filter_55_20]PJB81531.1 MA